MRCFKVNKKKVTFWSDFCVFFPHLDQQLNWFSSSQLLSRLHCCFWPGRLEQPSTVKWVILLMLVNKQLLIVLALCLLWKRKKAGRCSTRLLFALQERRIWVRQRHHLLCQGMAPESSVLFKETDWKRGGRGKIPLLTNSLAPGQGRPNCSSEKHCLAGFIILCN